MTTHKTDDYKNSAVKCHLNDIKGGGTDIRKLVKFLIVKNLLFILHFTFYTTNLKL